MTFLWTKLCNVDRSKGEKEDSPTIDSLMRNKSIEYLCVSKSIVCRNLRRRTSGLI